jgi:hypothetical protein
VLRRFAVPAAAVLFTAFFLATTFRTGWTRLTTDFPNYYTAAVLARRGLPLRHYYDWTWFQRQMNFTGSESQLGGYIPQTPATMLPFIPLSWLPQQDAKRAWLLLNLCFLGASLWMLQTMLHTMTRFSMAELAVIAFLGYGALHTNFLFGQYYIFVLFLITCAFFCLARGRAFWGGALLGGVFALKLYGGPFLLYFAWKRQWRAVAGMAVSGAAFAAVSLYLFGRPDNDYFLSHVLPRALEGMTLDPFHPANGTFSTLLRRAFLSEPELNPHPLLNLPFLYFFLQPFLVATVLIFVLIPRGAPATDRRDLAWFLIAMLLISPNTASYTFVILLPAVVLLEPTVVFVAAYVLLCLPLYPAWSWCFPKAWLILAMYLFAGRDRWRTLRFKSAAIAIALACAVAAPVAIIRQRGYEHEPSHQFERLVIQKGAVYSSSPASTDRGVFYESMDQGRYAVAWLQGTEVRPFRFDGEAFHPASARAGGPVYFELVSGRHSRIMALDITTGNSGMVVSTDFEPTNPAVSPDGRLIAFVTRGTLAIRQAGNTITETLPGPVRDSSFFPDSAHIAVSAGLEGHAHIFILDLSSGRADQLTNGMDEEINPAVSPEGSSLAFARSSRGTEQIWLQNLQTGAARQLTGGQCNSFSPAWEPSSKALIFASDCGRGLGLPALYRASLR